MRLWSARKRPANLRTLQRRRQVEWNTQTHAIVHKRRRPDIRYRAQHTHIYNTLHTTGSADLEGPKDRVAAVSGPYTVNLVSVRGHGWVDTHPHTWNSLSCRLVVQITWMLPDEAPASETTAQGQFPLVGRRRQAPGKKHAHVCITNYTPGAHHVLTNYHHALKHTQTTQAHTQTTGTAKMTSSFRADLTVRELRPSQTTWETISSTRTSSGLFRCGLLAR